MTGPARVTQEPKVEVEPSARSVTGEGNANLLPKENPVNTWYKFFTWYFKNQTPWLKLNQERIVQAGTLKVKAVELHSIHL